MLLIRKKTFTFTLRITFDAAGGTTPESVRFVPVGSPLGALPTPAKEGFYFNGWFSDGVKVSASTVPSDDAVLVAGWRDAPVATFLEYVQTNSSDNYFTGPDIGYSGLQVFQYQVTPLQTHDSYLMYSTGCWFSLETGQGVDGYFNIGDTTYIGKGKGISMDVGTRYNLEWTCENGSFFNLSPAFEATYSGSLAGTWMIGAGTTDPGEGSPRKSLRIHKVAYARDDAQNVVMDWRPALDDDGTACMLDMVSGEFVYAGGSPLTPGPEL